MLQWDSLGGFQFFRSIITLDMFFRMLTKAQIYLITGNFYHVFPYMHYFLLHSTNQMQIKVSNWKFYIIN